MLLVQKYIEEQEITYSKKIESQANNDNCH